jgi:hypothetical protein
MDKDISHLQVFDDYYLTINWMNNMIHILSIGMLQVTQLLKDTTRPFHRINFVHIFRELNSFANSLSKEALTLEISQRVIEKFVVGRTISLSNCNILEL